MPWECPIHGTVRVVAGGNEGYICTEDAAAIPNTDGGGDPYKPCGVPVGLEEETLP